MTVFLVSFIILSLFSAYIGSNPLAPGYANAYQLTKIIPEGWGFFTRNPREPVYKFYECDGDSFAQMNLHNNSFRSLAGLSKINRRYNLELQRLKPLIPDSVYVEAEDLSSISFNEKNEDIFQIEDIRGMDYHFIEENKVYAISVELIKPWLYVNKNIKYDNKFKIAKFKFTNKKDK